MSDEKENTNPLRRYLGKVIQKSGQYGTYLRLLIDNPTPTKLDKSTNTQVTDPHNKGILLWVDNDTGKTYLVKQLSVRGVSDESKKHGFTNSISIDLDNKYDVQELG